MNKHYLGDGAYIQFDGHSFILTTENGVETTNTIFLEAREMMNLFEYVKIVDPGFFAKVIQYLIV